MGKQRRKLAETDATDLAPEVQVVLAKLANAHDHAHDGQCDPRELAVELAKLYARGLTVSDLGRLVEKGYVRPAWEIAPPGDSGAGMCRGAVPHSRRRRGSS